MIMGNILCTCFRVKSKTCCALGQRKRFSSSQGSNHCPGNIYIAKRNYTAVNSDDLSFDKDDCFELLDDKLENWWTCRCVKSKKEGLIPSSHVVELNSVEKQEWYFDKMKRIPAEQLLLRMGKPGAFIVRKNENDQYSLSLRDSDAIKHYRIINENGTFRIGKKKEFSDLPALIHHYMKSADGLARTLKAPCSRLIDGNADLLEIPRDRIQLMDKLGKGHFAEVREAKWNDTIKVAVKILNSESMTSEKFLEEADILKRLKHERIIRLLAVCTIGEPVYIVLEYMSKGNLLTYLTSRDGHKLGLKEQLSISAQVADGLFYLSINDIVHRDIAARNILVNEHNHVKIADFGLSKFLHADSSGDSYPLAIKWTAPEAILQKQFTNKSDVWSFGILLYEIITKGKEPYPLMNKDEALQSVRMGYRMPTPKGCEERFYGIMLECWNEIPEERPGFDRLKFALDEYSFPYVNEHNVVTIL